MEFERREFTRTLWPKNHKKAHTPIAALQELDKKQIMEKREKYLDTQDLICIFILRLQHSYTLLQALGSILGPVH